MDVDKKKNPHAGHRQRKKAQFMAGGLDSFASHEALELLLYYAIPRVDTNEIAHKLLEQFGSLNGVFSAPVEELQCVEGVGENAALLLRLVPQIYRRSLTDLDRPGKAISGCEEAGHFIRKYFWGERNEVVMELCLDGKRRLLGCHRLSEGGVSASAFNVRDAVRYALADNAMYVYLAHNHPSGVAVASETDRVATHYVQGGLRTVGVTLLDHIIVAENDFISMASSGDLKVW